MALHPRLHSIFSQAFFKPCVLIICVGLNIINYGTFNLLFNG